MNKRNQVAFPHKASADDWESLPPSGKPPRAVIYSVNTNKGPQAALQHRGSECVVVKGQMEIVKDERETASNQSENQQYGYSD